MRQHGNIRMVMDQDYNGLQDYRRKIIHENAHLHWNRTPLHLQTGQTINYSHIMRCLTKCICYSKQHRPHSLGIFG